MSDASTRAPAARDEWFPVELSGHVPPGQVVQAFLLDQELALWRTADGTVQAWENRCPHRSVRLTLGFVRNDQLVCRYHGWRYGQDGRCTGIPSTPAFAPPPAACARTFACREAEGVIWASLSLLPRAYPPQLPPLDACRSFIVDASFADLANALDASGFAPGSADTVWTDADGTTLLLQPMGSHLVCIHLLVPASEDSALRLTRRLDASERIKSLLPQWCRNIAKEQHVQ
jgi:nitrite reductase/ring-hydroxylating ferredoxin subunit